MAVRPSLAHDASDDAYGEAMVRCQGYPPGCSAAGECERDGWCFGRDGAGFRAARRQVAALIEKERNVFVRSWLKLALDAMDHDQFERKASDALRLVAINKRIRDEYGKKP